MPVPSAITDLSTTAGSNYPAGSESPTSVDDYLRAHASFIAQLYAVVIPSGTMLDYAGAAAPTGYLVCDGSAVSRATYAALYTAIGTTWGAGDGSTTFNVPDMRRRVAIGSGGTVVSSPGNTVGSAGGSESKTMSTAEMPSHSHGISDPGHAHGVSDPGHSHTGGEYTGVNLIGGSTPAFVRLNSSSGNNTGASVTGVAVSVNGTGVAVQSTGSGSAFSLMQPSAVVTKIIKT